MNGESKIRTAPSIKGGHVIDLGLRHSIAIYERNGDGWVAEFHDDRIDVMHAGTWFRFYAGGLRYCHNRRTGLQSSTPLTSEMLEKIEQLHRESEARQEKILVVPRTLAAAARRYCSNVILRLRGRGAEINQTFS